MLGLVAALALGTFGRGVHLTDDRLRSAMVGSALLAGALTIGAARWGSPDLDHIRGAQEVLGPTALVGPLDAGLGAASAAVGALLSAALYLGSLPGMRGFGRLGYAIESALMAALLVTVFWWSSVPVPAWLVGCLCALTLGMLGLLVQRGSARLAMRLGSVAGAGVLLGLWLVGGAT